MREIAKVGLNNFNKHTPNPSPRKKRDRQEGTIYHFTNMKHKRFLPLLVVLVPAISLGFLELFYFNPKLIYVVLILINLSIFFAVWQFTKAGNAGNNWWDFMILPGLMSAAAVSYSILLSSGLLIQTLFCFYIVLLYIYLRYVYYYLARPAAYTAFSIENISSYGNFLTFFFNFRRDFWVKVFFKYFRLDSYYCTVDCFKFNYLSDNLGKCHKYQERSNIYFYKFINFNRVVLGGFFSADKPSCCRLIHGDLLLYINRISKAFSY